MSHLFLYEYFYSDSTNAELCKIFKKTAKFLTLYLIVSMR
jgi:hypothetical protein